TYASTWRDWNQTLDSGVQSKSFSSPMKRFLRFAFAGPISIAAPLRGLHRMVGLALISTAIAYAQPEISPGRLPRTNLLVFHTSKGEAQPVRSRTDWQKRRAEILRGMQQIMGPLPGKEKRCPLNVRMEEEVDGGSYLRRLITYASEPGARVPAYLL